MLGYEALLKVRSGPSPFSWRDRDTMLYALSVGMGGDPSDERELPFVTERNLHALPSLATVLAQPFLPSLEEMGIDFGMMLHGEQSVTLHRPLPPAGSAIASGRVTAAFDKGDRGAVILMETEVLAAEDLQPIATLGATIVARADGGFGGPADGQPRPHVLPTRPCDRTIDLPTSPNQALLYRLNGDLNPLHWDPAAARRGGFGAPILHGLCTYGLTGKAVLVAMADYDADRIVSHHARFSAPMYPGEVLSVDLWQDGEVVSFQARVRERDVTVISNGRALLRG
jgi:acyl dehydratase